MTTLLDGEPLLCLQGMSAHSGIAAIDEDSDHIDPRATLRRRDTMGDGASLLE
ncbi:hypothetical protein [Sinimarinibacterium thermocellulolyticum]|uniref:Uncharacterized protein n=1 Tax=Sinimarinibacterium thermocellulolyticum TaxID=3170016 RepID=A0ABV2ADF8_9GAMM